MQTSLLDIHSLLEAFRLNVFPSQVAFDRRYIRRESKLIYKGGDSFAVSEIVGYKNMKEFKEKVSPYILRRSASDVEEDLPEISIQTEWLSMTPKQKKYYDQARSGVLEIFKERVTSSGDIQRRRMKINSHFHHIQYACDSTWSFDKNDLESSKIEWIIRQLKNSLKNEKVVVFSRYLNPVYHLTQRLNEEGIGVRQFIGSSSMSDKDKLKAKDDFWSDDSVRVLVGTSALVRGLNLQKSAYMIMINQISSNPSSVEQLIGRIRRIGSEHSKVILINLLIENSVEGRLLKRAKAKAAIPGWLFDEKVELFEQLSDDELLELIRE